MQWFAGAVKEDVAVEYIDQANVALLCSHFRTALGSFHRFRKAATLSVIGRQRAKNDRVLATGKL